MSFSDIRRSSRHTGCRKHKNLLLLLALLLGVVTSVTAARPIQQDPEPEPEPVLNCTLSRWRDTKVLLVQFNHLAPIESADEEDLQISDLYHTARLYMPYFFRSQVSTTYTVVHKGFVEDAAVHLTPHFYKISIMNHMLRSYPQFDYFIWLDQDAMISNPDQQLVCLLEHWSVPPRTATNENTPILWIVRDPDAYHNYMTDANGQQVLNWNTGFMVWRNDDKSRQALQKWWEEALAHTEFHNFPFWDQSSFNGWVRPTFGPNDVYVIPCDEANGFGWLHADSNSVRDAALKVWKKLVNRMHTDKAPQFNCQGRFITHAWRVKNAVGRIMRDRLVESVVQTDFPDPLVIQADFSLAVQTAGNSTSSTSGLSSDFHEQEGLNSSRGTGDDGASIGSKALSARGGLAVGVGARPADNASLVAQDANGVEAISSSSSSARPAQASISTVDLFAGSSSDLAAAAAAASWQSSTLVSTATASGDSSSHVLINVASLLKGSAQSTNKLKEGSNSLVVDGTSISNSSSSETTDSSSLPVLSTDDSSISLDVGLTMEEDEAPPPA